MSSFGNLKKIICLFRGHQPLSRLVKAEPVVYRCNRCNQLIKMDKERGWSVYHE